MLLSGTPTGKSAAERMIVMDQIVATYGLTKRYKDFCAVSQLDMTVRKGRIYGFLGPNGAGKSTTLKMLLGLVQPSSGSIQPERCYHAA